MNISDEAVEAAARKLHEIAPVHYYAQEYDDLSGNDMEEMREDVRQILEAGGKALLQVKVEVAELGKSMGWATPEVRAARLDHAADGYEKMRDAYEAMAAEARAEAARIRAGEA